MSAVGLAIAFAIFVAVAVLAPIFGVDTRPGADEPAEAPFGSARSEEGKYDECRGGGGPSSLRCA